MLFQVVLPWLTFLHPAAVAIATHSNYIYHSKAKIIGHTTNWRNYGKLNFTMVKKGQVWPQPSSVSGSLSCWVAVGLISTFLSLQVDESSLLSYSVFLVLRLRFLWILIIFFTRSSRLLRFCLILSVTFFKEELVSELESSVEHSDTCNFTVLRILFLGDISPSCELSSHQSSHPNSHHLYRTLYRR